MRTLRLKISDIFEFAGAPPAAETSDVTAITSLVQSQFGFLPQPLVITIEGHEVVLQFPDESTAAQSEAARLAQKAAKRAAQGDYAKAIAIYQRVLELQPSLHSARRDLAMAYVETGDVENATNHLIEVLRLDPQDAWGWVVLANLYIREKSDPVTGEKFLRKALEIKPDDPWALNSLAALYQKRGHPDQAIGLYEKVIAANPEFANAYLGEAMTYDAMQKPEEALGALNRLFALGKIQDARTRAVFESARGVYAKLQVDVARRNQSEAFKCVQNYKAELEVLSGFPVRIEEQEFKDKVGARIQMAWTHGRDHHLIATRRGFAPELLSHLETHELTHLKMESEARQVGKNLFFTTTEKTQEIAIRSVAGDIRKIQKEGYAEESITKITLSLISGLCGFLFNCPLDMLIERHIRQSFPVLHPAQYLSLCVMAMEAWQANSNPEFRKVAPKKIVQASLALNGAWCLFLDELFGGASELSAPYRNLDSFAVSRRLHDYFVSNSSKMGGVESIR